MCLFVCQHPSECGNCSIPGRHISVDDDGNDAVAKVVDIAYVVLGFWLSAPGKGLDAQKYLVC